MISIKVEGLDKLVKKFQRLPAEMKSEIKLGIRKSALLIERKAKPITPVDTGRLRSSIRSDIRPLEAFIAPHTDYAVYVHEGTYKMIGRPFMKKGAEQALPEIQQIFRQIIQEALRR